MGQLIYGCDICQDVCPWNVKFSQQLKEAAFEPREILTARDARTLAGDLLALDEAEFRASFMGSPVKRAKRRGLARNAAVVLGNVGTADDVGLLARALGDPEPVVRQHVVWALGRIGTQEAMDALRERSAEEPEAEVLEELRAALTGPDGAQDRSGGARSAPCVA